MRMLGETALILSALARVTLEKGKSHAENLKNRSRMEISPQS